MKILIITNAKRITRDALSREYDKIIIHESASDETLELLETRLNRKNPNAEIITGRMFIT